MSRIANCPQCGAPITFAWADAIQVACPYCQSVLVRNDVSLTRLGQVSHVKPDPSPIQLLTEGVYKDRSFQVVGRLQYEYASGGWNEWHLIFSNGESGWLSDAQLEYAISFLAKDEKIPAEHEVSRGQGLTYRGIHYQASTLTEAHYIGMQGELPFIYEAIETTKFVDLRSRTNAFGTIDYSETPPLLFLGESVTFESLKLKYLREFEGWRLSE